MSAPVDCGIEMVRGSDGYLCGRMGSEVFDQCILCPAKRCNASIATRLRAKSAVSFGGCAFV